MLRVSLDHDIDGIEQSLEIAFVDKGRAEIRHDAVAHEHHLLRRKVDEHGIASLAAAYRNQLERRAIDLDVRAAVDGHVRLVATDLIGIEHFTEELLSENARSTELALDLFLIIAAPKEPRMRF